MPSCTKCNQNLSSVEIFECSLCSGIYHPRCASPQALNASGQLIQGCFRCAKDEDKRKCTLLAASNLSSKSTSEPPQPHITHSFIRPPSFQIANSADSSLGITSNQFIVPSNDNLTKLIQSMIEKVNCLPDLVTKVESIEKNVSNVEEIRINLSSINTKLT